MKYGAYFLYCSTNFFTKDEWMNLYLQRSETLIAYESIHRHNANVHTSAQTLSEGKLQKQQKYNKLVRKATQRAKTEGVIFQSSGI